MKIDRLAARLVHLADVDHQTARRLFGRGGHVDRHVDIGDPARGFAAARLESVARSDIAQPPHHLERARRRAVHGHLAVIGAGLLVGVILQHGEMQNGLRIIQRCRIGFVAGQRHGVTGEIPRLAHQIEIIDGDRTLRRPDIVRADFYGGNIVQRIGGFSRAAVLLQLAERQIHVPLEFIGQLHQRVIVGGRTRVLPGVLLGVVQLEGRPREGYGCRRRAVLGALYTDIHIDATAVLNVADIHHQTGAFSLSVLRYADRYADIWIGPAGLFRRADAQGVAPADRADAGHNRTRGLARVGHRPRGSDCFGLEVFQHL